METVMTSLSKARAETYQLLSALFCEPEEDVLGDREIFFSLKESLSIIQPNLGALSEDLIANYSEYPISQLLKDYTKIFMGPFNVIAYPYSSVYYGEKQS